MTPTQNAINKLISELDQVALSYEMRWGVYKLESLAPEPLAEKVQSQVDKLTAAIHADDLPSVRDLVAGCIRMYAALESSALSLGHKPCAPQHWNIRLGSRIYHVVRSSADARSLHKPDGSGEVTLTIEELIRAYAARSDAVLSPGKESTAKTDKLDIDWSEGETIPF